MDGVARRDATTIIIQLGTQFRTPAGKTIRGRTRKSKDRALKGPGSKHMYF